MKVVSPQGCYCCHIWLGTGAFFDALYKSLLMPVVCPWILSSYARSNPELQPTNRPFEPSNRADPSEESGGMRHYRTIKGYISAVAELYKIQVSLHKTSYPNFRGAAFGGKIEMLPAFVLMLVSTLASRSTV